MAAAALPLLALLPGDLELQTGLQEVVSTADQSSFGPGALGYTFFTMFSGFALGLSQRELHTAGMSEAIAGTWPWLLLFALVVVPLAVWTLRRYRAPELMLMTVLVVVPVALAGAASVVADVGYRPRYVSWTVIPLIVLAAIALAQVDWRVAASALLVVTVAAGWAYGNRHWSMRYGNEDLAGVVQAAEKADPTGAVPLLVTVDYMVELADYYAAGTRSVLPVPVVWDANEGLVEAVAEIDRIRDGGPFFLLYTREFHGDIDGSLLAKLTIERGVVEVERLAGATLLAGGL